MHPTLASILESAPLAILFGAPFAVGIVAIVSDAVRKVVVGRAREEARREIAAYVAEGSMTAEDAARILAAGVKPAASSCCRGDAMPGAAVRHA